MLGEKNTEGPVYSEQFNPFHFHGKVQQEVTVKQSFLHRWDRVTHKCITFGRHTGRNKSRNKSKLLLSGKHPLSFFCSLDNVARLATNFQFDIDICKIRQITNGVTYIISLRNVHVTRPEKSFTQDGDRTRDPLLASQVLCQLSCVRFSLHVMCHPRCMPCLIVIDLILTSFLHKLHL